MTTRPFSTVRHPKLSLWQSSVQSVAQRDLQGVKGNLSHIVRDHPMLRAATRHVNASQAGESIAEPSGGPDSDPDSPDFQTHMSQLHYNMADAKAEKDSDLLAQATAAYRPYATKGNDLKWAECEAVYLDYYWLGARDPEYRDWNGHDLNYSLIDYQVPSDARVAIIGDWGTGLDDSRAMLSQIKADHSPAAILHVGDVYYSGTPDEYDANLTAVFNEVYSNDRVPFFMIPGNHDYYARGEAFYKFIDTINASETSWRQQASYFCLRTADQTWQFLGMDTGINDHNPVFQEEHPGLMESEYAWHFDKLNNFSGRTILLSHHQLFSANADLHGDPKYRNNILYNKFSSYFPKVAAWFWGHEHNLAIYQNGLFGLEKGRLVGCSSYEETQAEDPYQVNNPEVPYQTFNGDVVKLGAIEGYYNHGYAIVDLKRAQPTDPVTVSYFQLPSWYKTVNTLPSNQPRQLATEQLAGASGISLHTT